MATAALCRDDVSQLVCSAACWFPGALCWHTLHNQSEHGLRLHLRCLFVVLSAMITNISNCSLSSFTLGFLFSVCDHVSTITCIFKTPLLNLPLNTEKATSSNSQHSKRHTEMMWPIASSNTVWNGAELLPLYFCTKQCLKQKRQDFLLF